ncbi:Cof-type HAD-IIB family hydrolase [Mycoplasma crocodyli]|uniref:COF family haloacid dehalogenase(HAD)-like hydrolase n=1 Tax=Mycoplasma crocodyli (strain ATCC 51981 / MP145) TaxID=512564 RepID=D5E6H4_MYCCM|nr:Cof-type HAD-IIB family hydrolase [Mycoplasma crocodyli]ADE19646.1 COF family haloacid dehalogenase(HAD)-like hydrolase [Mycoplasma crocodyli MP145]
MKKIFAFDLDGTLLNKENKLHPHTKKIIIKANKLGHTNVVATGRGIKKVMPLIVDKTLEGFDYLICSNGAFIYDVKNKHNISLGKVEPSSFDFLEKLARERNLIITLDTDKFNGTWIPKTDTKDFPDWMNETLIMDMNILNRCSLEELRIKANEKDAVIFQIALRSPIEIAKEVTKQALDELGNKHAVFLTNAIYTDVCPFGVSKYNALEQLIQNISFKGDLIAFGDSGNDIEMLQHSKKGFAMGNATEDAKQVADEVIGDHNTGTIGETIERFI